MKKKDIILARKRRGTAAHDWDWGQMGKQTNKDYAKSINKIPYVQINSMSYKWVGEKLKADNE